MDSLIKVQINSNKTISKARSNFKKSSKDRLTVSYIETRLEALESQWSSFVDIHNKLIANYDEEELEISKYVTCNIYEVTQELFFDYKSELKDKLNEIKPNISIISKINNSSNEQAHSVRLAKITIPMFSGSYSDWTSFRDLFMSLVHTNSALDNVQKLHYLKTHLSGEAEQLLRHVPVTSDNYLVCWNQLEARYNNKRYIANSILKRFMSQKNITYESSNTLKELLDTSNECINALTNLGLQTETWDIIIIHILSLKLDTESRKLWESRLSDSTESLPTYKQFSEFLNQRFRSLEFLDTRLTKSIIKTKALHVTEIMKCPFCSDNHRLSNCKKFVKEEPEARRSFVQTQGFCFNCFGSNHSVYSCRVPSKCKICQRKHHSLLHMNSMSKTRDSVNPQNSPGEEEQNIVKPEIIEEDETTERITTCHINMQGHILLPTALVGAMTKSGTYLTLRSLLDQGSQASFITESAVQLLGLQKKASKSYVSGLGSDRDSVVTSQCVVNINIQSLINPKFVTQVKAHVLKEITTLLPDKEVPVQRWSSIPDVRLADPTYNMPNKIDILLGSDVYYQVIQEGLIRCGPDMPVAQNTKLGWILSGKVIFITLTVLDELKWEKFEILAVATKVCIELMDVGILRLIYKKLKKDYDIISIVDVKDKDDV
ncbi:uncharacterized protein LOC131847863 [Achroia grisella]|uniref:uncharacterized protein LOC131847863 n=1 Tax=Achroia grisella TaxID=688607 RepID=UPI0027D24599|nr:uncharacterized protein LOC131847863 [Achroia grisella]